jgi:elongation factor 2
MAFGRIFSGTLKTGDKMMIYTSESDKGTLRSITNLGVCMSKEYIPMQIMPCGNTVVIGGVENAILKEATLTSQGQPSMTFKHMKFSVSPVVEVAVKPCNPTDIDKLAKGLAKLSQIDQLVKIYKTESGEYVIAGAGDLHIEICISQLKSISKIDIITSEPQVSYRETCIGSCSSQLSKSGNKHNRLYTECEGMNSNSLLEEIEEKDLLKQKKDQFTAILRDTYEWEPADIKKIMSFGVDDYIANILLDKTVGMQYMQEIKSSIIDGFQNVLSSGPLCGEKLRGVIFKVTDAKIHEDPAHRGAT